jgi:large subunit ribosomal protein L30e
MAMDVNREIRRAVDTGKVLFGKKQAEKSVLKGAAGLIVISSKAPLQLKERISQLCAVSNTPVFEFQGTGHALGGVCGKPFLVSVLCVEKAGKSRVMDAVKQKK